MTRPEQYGDARPASRRAALRGGVIALALAAAGAAWARPKSGGAPVAAPAGPRTLLDAVAGARDLKTFGLALRATDLAATLEGAGPFTLFTPTDAAFKALPPGTVEALLKPETRPQLTAVLSYHVVPGALLARDLARMVRDGGGRTTLTTLADATLMVERRGAALAVIDANDAVVPIGAEIVGRNGVIHVIDNVLLP